MLDSRKGKISLREAGSYSYWGIMLGIREIIRFSSKLSGSPFTPGIHYRGSNLTIEYELVCLVNYFFLLLLLFSIVFGNKKGIRESDQEKCGV